jgi:hypothetical protein
MASSSAAPVVTAASASPELPTTLSSFRSNDVLLGRGSGPNRWEGNVRFRATVQRIYTEFLASRGAAVAKSSSYSALDPYVKNQLARQVLSAIHDANGRFLQKMIKQDFLKDPCSKTTEVIHEEVEQGENSKITVVYVEAHSKKAMEKIKQTFRFLYDQKLARRRSKDSGAKHVHREAVKASFSKLGAARDASTKETAAMGESTSSAGSTSSGAAVGELQRFMPFSCASSGVTTPLNAANLPGIMLSQAPGATTGTFADAYLANQRAMFLSQPGNLSASLQFGVAEHNLLLEEQMFLASSVFASFQRERLQQLLGQRLVPSAFQIPPAPAAAATTQQSMPGNLAVQAMELAQLLSNLSASGRHHRSS